MDILEKTIPITEKEDDRTVLPSDNPSSKRSSSLPFLLKFEYDLRLKEYAIAHEAARVSHAYDSWRDESLDQIYFEAVDALRAVMNVGRQVREYKQVHQ